ncbi:hypothetical protein GM30_08095 [Trabulsiella odontotermitis]|nr:hypothetical protein GM30_08095 [Trabulsiella odontotermitis]
MHQRRAGERADDRRNQHDGGNYRHQLDALRLSERFLNGHVANGGDKADAGALYEPRHQELFHGGGKQRGGAGEGKNQRAGDEYRATTNPV